MTEQKLLLDAMVGKLAPYLRMCGYDAVYCLDEDIEADDLILDYAQEDGRTIVTRDRSLAARSDEAVLLESKDVRDQLREFDTAGFELELSETPERCGRCNGPVRGIDSDEETPEYAPDPTAINLWRCEECGQYFWKGSHWDDVAETLDEIA